MEEVKTVPPLNQLKKQPVFLKGSIADQAGARPGYRRQWVKGGEDPASRQHPNHVEKYLRNEIFVGDGDIGYCKAEGWTVVPRSTAKPGRKRDDDTAGVDTGLTHGDLVCIETPEENAEIWDAYRKMRADRRANALRDGEVGVSRADNGGSATVTARLGQGNAGDDPHSAVRYVLNQ